MTRQRILGLRIFLGAVLVACAVGVGRFVFHEPHMIALSKRDAALMDIQPVYSALYDFGGDNPGRFRQVITEGQHSLRGRLALELEPYLRVRAEIGTNRLTNLEAQGVRDPWGEPFILIVSEIKQWTNAAGIVGRWYQVSFRSLGPNKRDDKGLGDDSQSAAREIFVPAD